MVTGRRTGHPVRSLKTEFSRSFVKIEADPSISNDDIAKLGGGALRAAAVNGDKEKGSFMAGQIAGLVKKEQTCSEMILEMFDEFEKIIKSVRL
jgi:enoyl-[acyl-carrier protein] reductase II